MNKKQTEDLVFRVSQVSSMYCKLVKTMNNTAKSDKYVRMMSNICKLLRAASPALKKKYSHLYKQLLILRQVIRWQGIYQSVIQIHKLGWRGIQWQNISELAFIGLGMFGDILDRIIFILQTLNIKKYQGILTQIDHMQSDCYFIQCIIWLLYHIRTAKKEFTKGNSIQRRTKMLKITKYLLDSITSYCKFSRRVWELQPKRAAVLGIISSIIGLYDILK